eukprot:COSAG06_NODE_39147_length_415_cov_12.174051_1_plen_56_part_01
MLQWELRPGAHRTGRFDPLGISLRASLPSRSLRSQRRITAWRLSLPRAESQWELRR